MSARAIVHATHSASVHASEDDKKRARKAALTLGNTSVPDRADVFNAFLNLIHRGAPATEANILAESRKLRKASERFAAEQHEKRERRAAA